jgi:predicted transcriptional regulator
LWGRDQSRPQPEQARPVPRYIYQVNSPTECDTHDLRVRQRRRDLIIRIMADNQYRVDDSYLPELDKLDDPVIAALDQGDADGYASALKTLVDFVREHSEVLPLDEVVPSDSILPAPDMTLDEVRALMQSAEVKMPT